MPSTIIIADSSCLIALSNINALWILEKVYQKIYITNIIAKEYDLPLPDFIDIKEVHDVNVQKILLSYLDPGEASAIALGLENSNSLLILDDLKGRKEALKLELKYTGTLGVLVRAKKENHISDISFYIIALKSNGFRISDNIIELALKESEK
jgi:predicted nucleic acid-binding protein